MGLQMTGFVYNFSLFVYFKCVILLVLLQSYGNFDLIFLDVASFWLNRLKYVKLEILSRQTNTLGNIRDTNGERNRLG